MPKAAGSLRKFASCFPLEEKLAGPQEEKKKGVEKRNDQARAARLFRRKKRSSKAIRYNHRGRGAFQGGGERANA